MRKRNLAVALFLLLNIGASQCLATTITKKHYLEPGKRVELAPGVFMEADEEGPYVVFGKERDFTDRNFLYLSKNIDLWNGGTRAKAEFLGIKRSVVRPEFVVRTTSESSAAPALSKQSASGRCDWNFNNPASSRDGLNFALVSTKPLLMVGSASDSTDLLVVTNYGVATMPSDALRASAIEFEKNDGKVIVCPWNEKLRDYDVPQSARGHGIILGPINAKTSKATNIGPSGVILTMEYPDRKFTASVSLNKTQSVSNGPFILAYEVPDFYSASLGMQTYVEETTTSQTKNEVQRYYKPDADLPAAWHLKLNPPIMEEFGLGPNGPATGEAVIECTLWKFGDQVYGNGGYSYSDCGLRKGGQIEGTIIGDKMSLRMTGDLNMQLDGPAPSATAGSKGTAIIANNITSNATGNKREFTLSPSSEPTPNPLDKFLTEIAMIPPGTAYWNVICALPNNYVAREIMKDTIELVQAEQKHGTTSSEALDGCSDLADMQYTAWCQSANSKGKNHPITLAHAEIAECLFKRILDGKRSGSEYRLKNYTELLKANGKLNEAKLVEEQMEKLPKN